MAGDKHYIVERPSIKNFYKTTSKLDELCLAALYLGYAEHS